MNKMLILSLPLLSLLEGFTFPVEAEDALAKFSGGIGVIPVSNVTATGVTPNVVRGVNPAGQLWVIRKLEAEVKTNGDIKVTGKGLVFGGGNSVGRATGQRVFATLICEAAAPFTEHSSLPVPLDANGNFSIDDALSPAPTTCDSPTLLIRNAGNSAWFAAGIPDDQ